MRATARRSPNPQESGRTTKQLTTTLRPLSARHTRQRNGRRHNSSSPSLLIPGSENFETQKPFTRRLPRRASSHTYKRGAQSGTPLTYWRCIMKLSAITPRSRESPSILIFSRTRRGKPDERGKQSPTKPYSFSPPPPCSQ